MATCKNCIHYKVCKTYGRNLSDKMVCLLYQDKPYAQDVVRCKDCRHCGTHTDSWGNNILYCKKSYGCMEVDPDCFCSYGERAERKAQSARWIRVDDTKCKCSNCGIIAFIALYSHGDKNFCPNCGFEMEKNKESE